MRCRKGWVNDQCLFQITTIELNRHSHVIKIHNVVGIPDHTICFGFFIANRDDVLISVFLDSKPQCLGTISDISFAIPFDTLNYIFFMRTALIPLQNQLDKESFVIVSLISSSVENNSI